MRTVVVIVLALAAALPSTASAASMQAVIVHLRAAVSAPSDLSGRAAARRLERARRSGQAPLIAQLVQLQRGGHVRHIRSLWIANAVAMTADASAIDAVRERPDVSAVEIDAQLPLQPADAATGEPGVAAAGAPELWSHGIDGRGVTVAALDTGVDITHPELASRYRGGAGSWFDPYGEHAAGPVDLNGHGTEVMGIMVAGDGIGMAPGARFIAARVFNDAGVSSESAVHLAFQWALDPDGDPATDDAPDVVNASWGAQLAACDTSFQPDLQALRAAHILPVFAAGNDGSPGPSDTSPANLPEAFAVGATAAAGVIAPFSSLGPSRCGGGTYPALVASGTGIRSTARFGFDAQGLQGTSFSAPHVAGALALLLQVAPGLSADQQASLLEQSAVDLGPPGPDNTYGAGALAAAAALRRLSPALDFDPPVLSGASASELAVQVRADDRDSAIAAGEWWVDTDPGVGAGTPMTAADGALDSGSETLEAVLADLTPGRHVIGVRARDAAGNWSPSSEIALTIAAAAVTTTPAGQPAPIAAAAPQPLRASAPPTALQPVATDGFEHGLRGWRWRTGAVTTSARAALSGLRGLRATPAGKARTLVRRALPSAGTTAGLMFALAPRAFSSLRSWLEIAEISDARGRRVAWVELRSDHDAGPEVRMASVTDTGRTWHSRPAHVSRRLAELELTLDSARAALTVDGHELGALARRAPAQPVTTVALGLPRGARATTTGSLDFDRVTILAVP